MKNENEEIIKHYQQHISEIEEVIDKVDNDKVLSRNQRTRLITFLERTIYHCKGMISTLDGTYHKE